MMWNLFCNWLALLDSKPQRLAIFFNYSKETKGKHILFIYTKPESLKSIISWWVLRVPHESLECSIDLIAFYLCTALLMIKESPEVPQPPPSPPVIMLHSTVIPECMLVTIDVVPASNNIDKWGGGYFELAKALNYSVASAFVQAL